MPLRKIDDKLNIIFWAAVIGAVICSFKKIGRGEVKKTFLFRIQEIIASFSVGFILGGLVLGILNYNEVKNDIVISLIVAWGSSIIYEEIILFAKAIFNNLLSKPFETLGKIKDIWRR